MFDKLDKNKNKRSNNFFIVVIITFSVLFIAAFVYLAFFFSRPIEVISYETMCNVLESNEFIVNDITEQSKSATNENILKTISARKDDVCFNFYIMNSSNSANNMFLKYENEVWSHETAPRSGNSEHNNGQWIIYATRLTKDKQHYVITRVGNTFIYAYGPQVQSKLIYDILGEIGYPAFEHGFAENSTLSAVGSIFIMLIVVVPLTRMSLSWLRNIIYNKSEVSLNDRPTSILKMYKALDYNAKNKNWVILFVLYIMCFIPTCLSIVQSLVQIIFNTDFNLIVDFRLVSLMVMLLGLLVKMFLNKIEHNK